MAGEFIMIQIALGVDGRKEKLKTWLELHAFFLRLKSLAKEISNSIIHVHSDNTSAFCTLRTKEAALHH